MSEQAPRTPFASDRTRALEAELAATRAALAGTVDELTDRLNPRTQATRVVADGKRMVANLTDPDASDDDRKRAMVAVGVAAAAVALIVAGVVRAIVKR
jgi:hypothetical protein